MSETQIELGSLDEDTHQAIISAVSKVLRTVEGMHAEVGVNALVGALNVVLWTVHPHAVEQRIMALATANMLLTERLLGPSPIHKTEGMTKQ